MKISERIKNALTQKRKPGGPNAELGMNIEGEAIVRGKDGKIKKRFKMQKRKLFGF